jgi:hypothetical protein
MTLTIRATFCLFLPISQATITPITTQKFRISFQTISYHHANFQPFLYGGSSGTADAGGARTPVHLEIPVFRPVPSSSVETFVPFRERLGTPYNQRKPRFANSQARGERGGIPNQSKMMINIE